MIKPRYDGLAREYAEHRRPYASVLNALRKGCTVTAHSHVLEVGCGTGNYAIALQTATRCECVGVDISTQMLAVGRARSKAVRFRQGNAEELRFRPGSFDVVFSVDVIHHLKDIAAYFASAWRVLAAGGTICTVTDSRAILRRRLLSTYFPATIEPELERYPTIPAIKRAMRGAGFGSISTEVVEHPYQLIDVQGYRDKAYLSLHLISQDAFEHGIKRMERDLKKGLIEAVTRYLLVWGHRLALCDNRGGAA